MEKTDVKRNKKGRAIIRIIICIILAIFFIYGIVMFIYYLTYFPSASKIEVAIDEESKLNMFYDDINVDNKVGKEEIKGVIYGLVNECSEDGANRMLLKANEGRIENANLMYQNVKSIIKVKEEKDFGIMEGDWALIFTFDTKENAKSFYGMMEDLFQCIEEYFEKADLNFRNLKVVSKQRKDVVYIGTKDALGSISFYSK